MFHCNRFGSSDRICNDKRREGEGGGDGGGRMSLSLSLKNVQPQSKTVDGEVCHFYSYPDPTKYSAKLVGVKQDTLYNPCLPALRRMEMDAYCGRLSDEHSRTSSHCYRGDFQRAVTTLFTRTPHYLPSLGITETGRKILRHSYIPDELKCTQVDWKEMTDLCPGGINIAQEDRPETCSKPEKEKDDCSKDVEFTGYAVRYLRPRITAAWMLPLARYLPQPVKRTICPEPWCGGSY